MSKIQPVVYLPMHTVTSKLIKIAELRLIITVQNSGLFLELVDLNSIVSAADIQKLAFRN